MKLTVTITICAQTDNNEIYVYKIVRISLARTRIKLWIFISFLPNKLGNNDALLDKICPTLMGKTIFTKLLYGIYKLNGQISDSYTWWHNLGNIYSSVVKVS